MPVGLGTTMACEADNASLENKFDAAVRVIRSLSEDGPYQPSDDMMMMFYSYYQQATSGPCYRPRPAGFWDTAGKAKWDAWRSLGEMTREQAMAAYIDDIQLILETLPMTEEVSALLELLGNFYEEVEGGAEQEEEDRRPFTRPFASASGARLKSQHSGPLKDLSTEHTYTHYSVGRTVAS
ncbi:acyl-CoA-binding domain-containing protein 5A-like [Osmerus eperlanus]|uniref:acyl-CoA-binding domain-containing protein 5A-like n=1 Tax=Osmerus eperlanus TaxID=29151 RepID=UPI002E15CE02